MSMINPTLVVKRTGSSRVDLTRRGYAPATARAKTARVKGWRIKRVVAMPRCWVMLSEISFRESRRSLGDWVASKSRGGMPAKGSDVDISTVEVDMVGNGVEKGFEVGGRPGEMARRFGEGGAREVDKAKLTRRVERNAFSWSAL